MHEMSLMSGVFEAIDAALEAYQVPRVTKVKLQVGRLTNAEPDALDFAFQAFAAGTPMEGAVLEIELVPLAGCCKECAREFEIEGLVFYCPECKSPSIHIVRGRELVLESLEVEA